MDTIHNNLTTIVLGVVIAGFLLALWRIWIADKQQEQLDEENAKNRSSRPRRED